MYVKSLTLKGFKSFASATNLVLEPGITCIVGPNGSGKSNVVDALAWVMGEGSARSLRGGKMDDVIFAGTGSRQALGRAEVTMTIDNSDGALPIDYSEVTISRTMFRGGGSEYAINRTPCRLLDIQELLSDSGIGREMHVIVGQGQLDAVLRATPEERRGFIEEAAGVLKHRRRKEKALRKLDAMEANLTRVADLAGEVRRQLGPLGRQAETARRAQTIQFNVRDARLRLLADDLAQQRTKLETELSGEQTLAAKAEELNAQVKVAQADVARVDKAVTDATPHAEKLANQWYELSALAERLDATGRLAAERANLLTAKDDDAARQGRDPAELRRQAERIRGQEVELQAEVETAQAGVDRAIADREAAEQAHQAEQQRLVRIARAAADRREGLAKLQGQVDVRRSRTESNEAEIRRLDRDLQASAARVADAREEAGVTVETLREAEAAEEGLNAAADLATAELEKLRDRQAVARDAKNAAHLKGRSAAARVEALEMSLGSASASEDELPIADGLRGQLVAHLCVQPGFEVAVTAALEWAASALVIESHAQAAHLIEALREQGAGRADLVVANGGSHAASESRADLPDGARWATEVVDAPDWLAGAVRSLLADVALVPNEHAAQSVARKGVRAVTADGDIYTVNSARGGGKPAQSALEIRRALDEAREVVASSGEAEEKAQQELAEIEQPLRDADDKTAEALDALYANDDVIIDSMERLNRHYQTSNAAAHERDRIKADLAQAHVALEANRSELEELEARLEAAVAQPEDAEPSVAERDRLAEVAAARRSEETEHRLSLRSAQERAKALAGRAESLESAARAEVAARERAERRRQQRRAAAEVANAVYRGSIHGRDLVRGSLERLTQLRDEQQAELTRLSTELSTARIRLDEASQALREVTDAKHREEVARQQILLRIEALEAKSRDEEGIEPPDLLGEYGPDVPVPVQPADSKDPDADEPAAMPYVRDEQIKRLKKAEKDLAALGKVNPLALEEFAALEERHTFLTEQLVDLRSTKKELLGLVAEVDARVEEVFSEAFTDVAREFEGVFARLFPGGEGRLVLTDPDNMLTTGLDVEARPPGKKIKRLSLLSGGERSLVAVALLVSIFKARPSPFYIMDEVEAALDDANLGRLITLFEELRDSSQLIVITHQKRTMEVADALYGVTMRGDGVTTVVSQRLADVKQEALGA